MKNAKRKKLNGRQRPPRKVFFILDAVSEAEIMAAMTPAGGWTRAQLAEWGVPWPPPTGWKQTLIANFERTRF